MISSSLRSVLVIASAFAFVACGGTQAPPQTEQTAGATTSTGDAGSALTAAKCKSAGGEVVGDIGNGAIHRPDYRCPRSGEPPLGPVVPEPGQPMAIEGAVCCR